MDPAIARSSSLSASFQAQQTDRAGSRAREDAGTSPTAAGFQPDRTDSAVFTPAAIAAADEAAGGGERKGDPTKQATGSAGDSDGEKKGGDHATAADGKPLSRDEQDLVVRLAARDRDVRAHEAAHQAAGGALAKGASFSYQLGPDGKSYAIGGEVQIDTGGESSPQATIAKMEQVRQAALAPIDPSSQDRAVAAAASQAEAAARRQLADESGKTSQKKTEDKTKTKTDVAATSIAGGGGSRQSRQAVAAYQQAGLDSSADAATGLALTA